VTLENNLAMSDCSLVTSVSTRDLLVNTTAKLGSMKDWLASKPEMLGYNLATLDYSLVMLGCNLEM